MNYNSLMNKPTINYRELIGDNAITEVGGITEEQFNTLLSTDLSSYYTKAQIDDLFSRSYVYREKSGSIVTFDCPASVNGIDKVVTEIVAVQSGTGDPSPTNVRPINGWSAVNVVVSPTTDAADGTTYTTALKDGQGNPLTCYGGTLSNVNGVQVLDNSYGYVEFDGSSDENWSKYNIGSASAYTMRITVRGIKSSIGAEITAISNYLQPLYSSATWGNYDNLIATTSAAPNTIITGIRTITDVEDWKTYLSNNPLQVKYKLATPVEIPQDSLSIASQEGTNNLWADSGDITVKALDKIVQG